MDPREAGASEEIVTKDLVPHRVHFRNLGEEAMAAHIEAKALVTRRAGQPSHVVQLFDDRRPEAQFGELVGGREAGRPPPDDQELAVSSCLEGHEARR